MSNALRDVTGFRGERIAELRLTDYPSFPEPLFRTAFLGDKWPALDFYVELTTLAGNGYYFLAQIKSTKKPLTSKSLKVFTVDDDIIRLLQFPAPTYLIGVHEPSSRAFAKSVHSGTKKKAITTIPLTYELDATNLKKLHDEVVAFWTSAATKPTTSVFK